MGINRAILSADFDAARSQTEAINVIRRDCELRHKLSDAPCQGCPMRTLCCATVNEVPACSYISPCKWDEAVLLDDDGERHRGPLIDDATDRVVAELEGKWRKEADEA